MTSACTFNDTMKSNLKCSPVLISPFFISLTSSQFHFILIITWLHQSIRFSRNINSFTAWWKFTNDSCTSSVTCPSHSDKLIYRQITPSFLNIDEFPFFRLYCFWHFYVEQPSGELSPPRKNTPDILYSTKLFGSSARKLIKISSVASPEPKNVTFDSNSKDPALPYGYGRQDSLIPLA